MLTLNITAANTFVALTPEQRAKINALCDRYKTTEVHALLRYDDGSAMMPGWAECQIGNIYFGISPEGDAHS